jgi:hypothetical protein
MSQLIQNFMRRFAKQPSDHPAQEDRAWSLSTKLAAMPDYYTMIVPSDLADLVREAKQLHPEVAYHASRRDLAVQQWVESARPLQSSTDDEQPSVRPSQT